MAKAESRNDSIILEKLSAAYPAAASELNFQNEYQLLVAVMLSAQCTDKKVNDVTPELFATFPDFESLSKAQVSKLENIIRPINYYKTKARHLLLTAQTIAAEMFGVVPRTMTLLRTLPGVGQKTANVILNELGVEATIPVDTHVFRVSRRLGFSSATKVSGVEEDLKMRFDSKHWRELHHLLILHGRRVCKARSPNCAGCVVAAVCPKRF